MDTPILGITEVAPNQNNKETTINNAFLRLEQALNSSLAVSLTAGDATLVTADFQSNFAFTVSGQADATKHLVIPNIGRMFVVKNTGSYKVNVKTASPSTTVDVASGSTCILLSDGANKIYMIADSAVAALAGTFLGLSDAPGSYSGAGGYIVRVNSVPDGLEFHQLKLEDTANWGTPGANQYPYWDGTGFSWSTAGGGPGAVNFKDLADVPAAYTGAGGQVVKVKSDESGLEFGSISGTINFTDLAGAPSSYSGATNKYLQVNATENGLQFVVPPSLGPRLTIFTNDTNAAFAAGTLAGWTIDVGSTDNTAVNLAGSLLPYSDGFMYQDASDTHTAGQISRIYDLIGMGATINELDSNSSIDLPWAFAMHTAGTTGLITIQALTDAGVTLGSVNSGTLSSTLDTWTYGSLHYDLPPGTRKIKVIVASSSSGTGIGACWDNLDPQLNVYEDAEFIQLTDCPASYTGAANYSVRVKADLSGLEFKAIKFTDNTDAPSSYSGQAAKLVRVNAGETALEFILAALDSLDDVVITTPATGQGLYYDGAHFVNGDYFLKLSGGTLTGPLFLDADPTLALHAATKQYVDSVVSGFTPSTAVFVASTGNLTLSGEQTIDGVLTSSSRVLVKDQDTASENGVYISNAGAWTRAVDANTWSELLGYFVFVEEGTVNQGSGYVTKIAATGTVGTDSITFVKFSQSSVIPLSGLSDVSVTEGAGIDGYVLYWNNGTSKWQAKVLPTLGTSASHDIMSSGDYRANTSGKVLTPDGVWGDANTVVLTDATTVGMDFSSFINAMLTGTSGVGGSRTLGAASNAKVGQSGVIEWYPVTGGDTLIIPTASSYVAAGGVSTLTLSTTNGVRDIIAYTVLNDGKILLSVQQGLSAS
jgi:hypothetical protein